MLRRLRPGGRRPLHAGPGSLAYPDHASDNYGDTDACSDADKLTDSQVAALQAAFDALDSDSKGYLNARDVRGATLISGMSVALNTTLVGAILYVWLIVNHRILVSGTVGLLTTAMQAAPDMAHSRAGQRAAAE